MSTTIAERTLTAYSAAPSTPMNLPKGSPKPGFGSGLVAGASVFGWATDLILSALGPAWLDQGWSEMSWRKPVYAGEKLLMRLDDDGGAGPALAIDGDDGTLRLSGRVGLGLAPWYSEIAGPPALKGSAANAAEVTRAPFAASTVGIQLTPLAIDMTAATARRYAIEVQRSEDDRFTGAEPIIHPGSIAFFQVQVILPQCDIGPGIHRWAQVQHLARPLAGKGYVGTGTVTSMYERGGRKYGQVDGSLVRDGVEIIRAREDFIYAMES